MSRRQREERMKDAAPKREAYVARQDALARGRAPRKGRSWTWLWIGLGLLVAAGGALVYALVFEPWWDRRQLLGQSGRAMGAVLGDGVVAVIDAVDVEHEHRDDPRRNRRIDRTRVRVLDAATGAVQTTHLFEGGGGGCVPATPQRLWCDLGGLALHDARTFERLARVDELIAKAGVARPVGQRWRVDGAVATWALDDGRAVVVDAVAMTAKGSDFVPRELRPQATTGLPPTDGHLPASPGCQGIVEPRVPGKPQSIAARGEWMIVDLGGRSQVFRQGKTASSSYIEPRIVGFVDDVPIIVHRASLDPKTDHGLVSRLGPGGSEPVWNVDLGASCMAARLEGYTVVVVTDDPGRRALAIDAATGAIRWAATR